MLKSQYPTPEKRTIVFIFFREWFVRQYSVMLIDGISISTQVIRKVVAKYRPNPADVDDLTQDGFLAGFAAELRGDIHEPEQLLFRIAKNLTINEVVLKVNTTSQSIEDSSIWSVYKDKSLILAEGALDARQRLEQRNLIQKCVVRSVVRMY